MLARNANAVRKSKNLFIANPFYMCWANSVSPFWFWTLAFCLQMSGLLGLLAGGFARDFLCPASRFWFKNDLQDIKFSSSCGELALANACHCEPTKSAWHPAGFRPLLSLFWGDLANALLAKTAQKKRSPLASLAFWLARLPFVSFLAN